MPIITISRGSYSKGKEIAEKLAERLNYKVLSRDVLLEASEDFNISEIKLVRALHDAPSVLGRFTYGKERYMAYIRKELLEAVVGGRVVYHGLAGHFLLKDVPNVLKVRIIADMEARIKEEMARENIDEDKARHVLKKDDDERRKWSLSLYGIDTNDPHLYDVIIHVDQLKVADAVELLYDTAELPCFKSTPAREKAIQDQLAAARVHAAIVKKFPTSHVICHDGECLVTVQTSGGRDEKIDAQIQELAKDVPDIKSIKTTVSLVMTAD